MPPWRGKKVSTKQSTKSSEDIPPVQQLQNVFAAAVGSKVVDLTGGTPQRANGDLPSSAQQSQARFASAVDSITPGGKIVEVVIPLRRSPRKNGKAHEPTVDDAPNGVAAAPIATPTPTSAPQPAAAPSSPILLNGDDEDDDGPPEAVSLETGRAEVAEEEKRLKEFEADTAAKRKEANRQRDRALKARAEAQGIGRKKRKAAEQEEPDEEDDEPAVDRNVEHESQSEDDEIAEEWSDEGQPRMDGEEDDGKEENEDEDMELGEDERLEARMRRAMQDAGDEDMDEGGEDPADERRDDADQAMEQAVTEEDEDPPVRPQDLATAGRLPARLPEHIFASAGASFAKALKRSRKSKSANAHKANQDGKDKKRRSAKHRVKDKVVGSTVVRVLPTHPQPEAGGQAARDAERLVHKKLALGKTSLASKKLKANKGWERREAHLAMSQRSAGPSRGFARSLRGER